MKASSARECPRGVVISAIGFPCQLRRRMDRVVRLQGWFSRPHFQSMHGDLLISSVSEGMETRNLNERRAQESIAIFGVMAAKV